MCPAGPGELDRSTGRTATLEALPASVGESSAVAHHGYAGFV